MEPYERKKGGNLQMIKLLMGEERLDLENDEVANLKYFVLEEAKFVEETRENMKTYGILVEKWKNESKESSFVSDITTEKENIMRITNCLKENKITPVHLRDLIMDII